MTQVFVPALWSNSQVVTICRLCCGHLFESFERHRSQLRPWLLCRFVDRKTRTSIHWILSASWSKFEVQKEQQLPQFPKVVPLEFQSQGSRGENENCQHEKTWNSECGLSS
ncbi:hypothetical protein K438DRAFT_847662 [Mycena galopus ATCC 62051]|nr:hypothetical protein K438DRAFT_847662 [Mycena galopus ATCC 62051]